VCKTSIKVKHVWPILYIVQYIDPPDNAVKYKCRVKFFRADNTEGVWVMHLTRSFDESLVNIFKSGNCGKLQCDVLSRLKIKENFKKLKLEIRKVGNWFITAGWKGFHFSLWYMRYIYTYIHNEGEFYKVEPRNT
jgi:hypothetical protein